MTLLMEGLSKHIEYLNLLSAVPYSDESSIPSVKTRMEVNSTTQTSSGTLKVNLNSDPTFEHPEDIVL